MKTYAHQAGLLLATCGWAAALPMSAQTEGNSPSRTPQAPNIILFLVDDMGWQDTSVPFATEKTRSNTLYETPNMEKLAQQGMLFTQAYASPVSSPSRCSLLTGANATRHKVTNWTLKKNVSTDEEDEALATPEWNCNGISPTQSTERAFVAQSFVQLLRDHGYHTIHCGKAHWGAIDTPGENPTAWGFNVNIGGHAAGGPATYLSERNYGNRPIGQGTASFGVPDLQQYWGSGTFLTEALTQEALKALDKAKKYNQPFFLNFSHYAIHIPIDKDWRFFGKYVRKGLSDKEAAYASLIEGMDKSLGDVMDWLERNGEAERTIILFMSDNGALATNSYWRDEPLYTQNYPLASGKGSLYEGGIREPMIVKWPGRVAGGTSCNKYVLIEDFFPSILEMAGVQHYKVKQVVDGISFLPLLLGKGDPSKNRPLVWNFPNVWGNNGPGINLNCAIRLNDWKLIYSYKTGKKELYNIATDLSEGHDLSQAHPEKVRELSTLLGKYLRQVKAQRPAVKATGQPCPWPDEM